MEAFIKKHPWAVLLGTAVLAFFIGHMVGTRSASSAIRARVLKLLEAGKTAEALKLVGGKASEKEEEAP